MADRVALITGGSAGLGAATARAFAAQRVRVVINYSSDSKRANALAQELEEQWQQRFPSDESKTSETESTVPHAIAIQADISSTGSAGRLVEETISTMGRLDVVFSNHGWTKATDFFNLDENVYGEDWARCFNMNVMSHLHLLHIARKHLEKTEGTFIFTSSTAGVRVTGSSLAYAVTKAAQIHLARCLAGIVAPSVRVNSVCPGMMITEWSSTFSAAKKEAAIQKTKLKRLATVEEVADQVCLLARSLTITGVNIVIDGGAGL